MFKILLAKKKEATMQGLTQFNSSLYLSGIDELGSKPWSPPREIYPEMEKKDLC
jgi:hypothetical protein